MSKKDHRFLETRFYVLIRSFYVACDSRLCIFDEAHAVESIAMRTIINFLLCDTTNIKRESEYRFFLLFRVDACKILR